MKPRLERVTFAAGTSLRVFHRRIARIPFEWHHHPEYELTLTLNSKGWRFVGDSRQEYSSPDLVLIPPDMPHTWASRETPNTRAPQTAIVVWFAADWAWRVSELLPEFAAIRKLLRRAAPALQFGQQGRHAVRSRVRQMLSPQPQLRLQAVLAILAELAGCEASPLAQSAVPVTFPSSGEPLSKALACLHRNFQKRVSIAALCRASAMSERALHREFVRHTGVSANAYLNRVRISHACMQLAESDKPVALIAAEAGFQNLANFHRRFKFVQQVTPSEFRREHRGRQFAGEPAREDLQQRPLSLQHAARPRLLR